ncbi:MAG TPA: glutamate--tRNA ligase [Thermoleophilaceae bacterium]|nr:glutamate--tRNA ligase [Thermoleophilaceae bacterium]
MSIRVRFAPSPTGALHIGGARTALYNWLLARGSGGDLVLRIEDTDRERSTSENVEQILDALSWLELDFDEGPIFQSERSERHREALQQLLDSGHAYRSNAASDEVKAWKSEHSGRGFRGEAESDGAIRLRVPDEGATVVHDVIRGDTSFDHVHIDDPVIARADGSVLYNFAVAIDDLDAGITHVVRGEDHLSNTPKQLLVLEALGAPSPTYAHLPLLHGPDGKKLSKRHGAASVQELRESGYLPEAVRNYIALLGWSLDDSTTLMSTEQMVESFDLARVSRSPAIFDEQKLRWMNGRYLRELEPAELARRLEQRLGRAGLEEAATLAQDKIQTLEEFWPLAGFLVERQDYDEEAWAKVMRDGARERLAAARAALSGVEPFDVAGVEAALRGVVEQLDVKPREVFQPLRLAIAGSTISPGIFESVAALGHDEALARIDDALARA